jgi:hypothetical protein
VRQQRRDIETFSLSFLDCICCGFGALILLLVLTEVGEPLQVVQAQRNLTDRIALLTQQLTTLRGQAVVLDDELRGRVQRSAQEQQRLSRLAGDVTRIQGQYAASRQDAAVVNIVERELIEAYQVLDRQVRQLLAKETKPRSTTAVGGIPLDSDYVIFVIDTSASMQRYHWPAAAQILSEILNIYPRVRGLQILDDEGKVMFAGTRGQWLNDTPAQRQQMVARMKTWRAFSNSSPVEGIAEAVRTYSAADKQIGLYVIGDEFTGDSYQAALDAVSRVNRSGAAGGGKALRIHAIGFPAGPGMPLFTNSRFSALMRLMCEQNNGSFVGLDP